MAAVPEEPAEAVTVKPDPDGGAPPPPPLPQSPTAAVPPPAVAAPLTEGEAPVLAGGESKSPVAPSAAPAASQLPTDRQTLLAVLQFLRRSNLHESEEILRREARLLSDEVAADPSPSAPGAPGTHGGESQESSLGSGETLLSAVTFAQTGVTVAPPTVAAPPAVPLAPPGKGKSCE